MEQMLIHDNDNTSFNSLLGAVNDSKVCIEVEVKDCEEYADIVPSSQARNRRYSDPTHNKSDLCLYRKQHHFATGLVPVFGDEIAHGMSRKHKLKQEDKKKGSQIYGIFLLCSVSLGVGVFVLPSVLILTGIGPGIVMLAFYAILALYTQLLVLECADICKCKGYEELASVSLGKMGEFLLALFMTISLLTGNCGHIATVGQLLHDIIDWFYTGQYAEYSFNWKKTAILYLVMLCLTLPWLFQKSLNGLSGVGTLSVMTVIITSFSLCIVCIIDIMSNQSAEINGNAPIYGFSKIQTSDFWITDFWRACPV